MKKIVKKAIALNIILEEEEEVYIYMYTQLFSTVFTWGSALLCALFLGRILEIMVFLVAFSTLRHYTGGLHAKSHLTCGLATVSLIAFVACISKFELFFMAMRNSIYGLGFALLVVFLFAPMGEKNKPISRTERIYFRKAACIIIVSDALIILSLYALGIAIDYLCFAMFGIYLSILLLVVKKIFCKKISEEDVGAGSSEQTTFPASA